MNYCNIDRMLAVAHGVADFWPGVESKIDDVIKMKTTSGDTVWATVKVGVVGGVIFAEIISAQGNYEDHGLFKGSGIAVSPNRIISVN